MSVNALIQKLKSREKLSARQLRQLFQARAEWSEDCSLPLARRALDMGENFLAYDIAEQTPERSGTAGMERLRIMALALARSGSLKRASELLALLPDNDDPEIIGLKSRIAKDVAVNSSDPEQQTANFLRAGRLSLDIFRKKRRYYNGINAATCLLMAGEVAAAQQLVRDEILPLCMAEPGEPDFWRAATLGECHLILREFDLSAKYYSQAAELATQSGEWGNLSSALRQLQMLGRKLGSDAEALTGHLKLPTIGIFSGHMIDRPDRPVPRFPQYAEEQVRRELEKLIRDLRVRIAFGSCACGGDILFIEEVLKAGGECYISLAVPLDKTIRNSVDIIPGADWLERMHRVLDHENTVVVDAECDEIGDDGDALVYDFTNRYLLGQALLKKEAMNFPIRGICVWDGERSGLVGGTDSAVELWRQAGIKYSVVKPEVRHG